MFKWPLVILSAKSALIALLITFKRSSIDTPSSLTVFFPLAGFVSFLEKSSALNLSDNIFFFSSSVKLYSKGRPKEVVLIVKVLFFSLISIPWLERISCHFSLEAYTFEVMLFKGVFYFKRLRFDLHIAQNISLLISFIIKSVRA